MTNIVTMPVQNGWYVSYEQDGTNRVTEFPVVPLGPPEKVVRVTVDDGFVAIDLEWLGFATVLNYTIWRLNA